MAVRDLPVDIHFYSKIIASSFLDSEVHFILSFVDTCNNVMLGFFHATEK
jgi:hypothetical protein